MYILIQVKNAICDVGYVDIFQFLSPPAMPHCSNFSSSIITFQNHIARFFIIRIFDCSIFHWHMSIYTLLNLGTRKIGIVVCLFQFLIKDEILLHIIHSSWQYKLKCPIKLKFFFTFLVHYCCASQETLIIVR